jgi:hypothetical protein
MDENMDIACEWEATSPVRIAAVRQCLAGYWISKDEIETVIAVLDQLGLFHARPLGDTSKNIRRQAKKAKSLTDRLKIMSKIFQMNRGGRIISVQSTGGRRPEPEVTRGLQILDRFLLERYPHWRGRYREECIADVLLAAGTSSDSQESVRDQVHNRLQEAKKKPLDMWDFRLATMDCVLPSKETFDRYMDFMRLQAACNDPDLSQEKLAETEAELGQLFRYPSVHRRPTCSKKR